MTNIYSTFLGRLRAAWRRSLTPRKSQKGQPRRRPALELLEDRAVPSTLHVSLLGSDTGDGSIAAPFRTVQASINAAAATADGDDVIQVQAGTYATAGVDLAIVIPASANLTNLKLSGGWDATFTTQDPTATPTRYVFRNVASLSGDLNILDSNVTISGFTWVFDGQAGAGASRTGSAGIVVQATDAVITNNQFEVSPRGASGFRPTAIQTASTDLTGLRITDNTFTFDALDATTPDSTSAAVGIFINPDAGGRTTPLVIEGNTFTGDNLGSAIVIKTTSNVEFTNNLVTRTGSSNTFLSLVDLRQTTANQTGIKIDSNDLINQSANATGAGILTNGDTFGSPTFTLAATFTNNNITGNRTGIAVDSWPGSNVVARSNALTGNTTGVLMSGATVVDFAGNWWGSASGPTVGSNPGGTGQSITGAGAGQVDYSLWLTTGTDTDPFMPGFQGDRATAFAGLTADEHFVQALYLDNLGRAGSKAELDSWLPVLSARGQLAVAGDIQNSFEARDRLVKTWYQLYLGRPAAGTEERNWVGMLQAGASEEQVLSQILGGSGSHEFYDRAQHMGFEGTADQNYVRALYQMLLGRTASDAEVTGWANTLPQLGRQGVALGFLKSQEFRTNQFEGYYNALLRRSDDPTGLTNWVMSPSDMGTVRIGFESSPEFFTNG